jgi:hypothetical protein
MKQNENDQSYKKESMRVVDNKPNGKSRVIVRFARRCVNFPARHLRRLRSGILMITWHICAHGRQCVIIVSAPAKTSLVNFSRPLGKRGATGECRLNGRSLCGFF